MSATFVGMPAFPEAARAALADTQLRANLAHATSTIRAKRAQVVAEVDDWEQLRLAGAAIKDNTLLHLDEHLLRLEESLTARGRDRALGARRGRGERGRRRGRASRTASTRSSRSSRWRPRRSTSTSTSPTHGIAAWETDLAELIVQLGDDLPSHILVPAIHRNRAEIREIFLRAHGRPPAGRRPRTSPTSRPGWPRRPGCTCARSSCARRSASPARTSRSPTPARWSSSSPRATAGCA